MPKIFECRVLAIIIIVFLPLLILNYALQWIVYHWQHRKLRNQQIPPQYPSFIPYIGSFLSFVLDGEKFLQRATWYAGKLTATKVKVLGTDVYLFQDYPSIRSIWKEQQLASPMAAYVYTLRYLCGQDAKSLAAYRADNSGPFPKPYPGSNIAPQNRVDYITHAGLLRGLAGRGLAPTTRRLSGSLDAAFEANLYRDDEWTQMPDLLTFFQRRLGTSIMRSLFGPTLLTLHPSFVDDFWEYERDVPRFAWGLPSFVIPRAYRNRERVIKHLTSWYAHARSQFTESNIDEDGDGDRLWGSELMRNRQKDLLGVEGQNDESLAAADLGLIWASVSNIVPSATFSTFHIFAEPGLLPRVRSVLDAHRSTTSPSGFNLDSLTKDPLLLSIYAETLRMYVKTYFVACSPHKDISLGNWQLPKGKVALVNSGISHMDQDFWNTRDGEYPVHRFWPDRFITYVHDPASGPIAPAMRRPGTQNPTPEKVQDDKGTFSLDGLEGSWIPYGGGHATCPGRFLAKNAIILSAALIADRYDVELLEELPKVSPAKFGLGSLKPGAALPFRIRRRDLGTKE